MIDVNIETSIQDLIDVIIEKRLTTKDKNELAVYKNVVHELEEAKINYENRKYFNLVDAVHMFPSKYNDVVYDKLVSLSVYIDDELFDIVVEFLAEEEEADEFYILDNINNVLAYDDLYEELVNVVLNCGIFEGEWDLIKINGVDGRELYCNRNYSLLHSYSLLADYRDKLKIKRS